MKRKITAIFKSVVLLLGFLMTQMIIPMVIGIYYGFTSAMTDVKMDPAIIEGSAQSQLSLVLMQLLGGLFLVTVFKIKKTKISDYIAFEKIQLSKILMFIAYGIAFQFVSIIGNTIVSQFYNLEKSAEVINNIIRSGNVFLSLIFVLILAPFIEEILFRGVILTKLNNHLSQKSAIIIQAVMFSLFHFNFAQMLPTFLLGLFLGFCYLKFRNIWVPIIIHFSFNLFASLVPYVPENLYIIIIMVPVMAGIISVTLTQKYAKYSH